MSQHIILSVDSRIEEGMASQLGEALEQLYKHIDETEPGTLFYTWYIDKAQRRCHVIQHYADGAALLFHLQNYKPFAEKFNALRKVDRVVCCGSIPDSLLAGFASAGVELFEKEFGSHINTQHERIIC